MARRLGLFSGIGLVVANMIGAGVFLSTGFMAQELGPGPVLLSWVTGAVLALAGTLAYAEVARIVPRSGGEYRYLSELLHPVFGYLAGWTSLLVGFSILANQFEQSAIPDAIPRLLPDNWMGGLVLLAIVFILSMFLDNIAAAIIGGVMAKHLYQGNVGVGFLAGIVAASNAGGR